MSDKAIRVDGIGKKYRIGKKKSGELRETFSHLWDTVRFKHNPNGQPEKSEFWALKDISFEVKQGEAVGIIGRNGAGKSTLLKVLSRITKPTTGRFEINGRVSSLLEVGTGFHPELTGRENIYLNGTILGMRRAEIKSKFDEIIAFSGVEEFIDTPVKHYSSGMKVRLAFSVAAHLEPEILIIDEVLAVGDAEFQKKCLGKMEDVTGEGRTVLFVSHNLGAVQKICRSAILIEEGLINNFDKTPIVINNYLMSENRFSNCQELEINIHYPTSEKVWLEGSHLVFEVDFSKTKLDKKNLQFEIAAYNEKGVKVLNHVEFIEYTQSVVIFSIPNIGYSEDLLNFDFGLKIQDENRYLFLEQNYCQVLPQSSSTNIKKYDVITIPRIEVSKK